MRPLHKVAWGLALAVLAAWGNSAQAGWNNVFQVCCANCGGGGSITPVVAGFGGTSVDACAPPCPNPCPPPCPTTTCTTRYVQRCFYQPVTTMRTSFYLQPVTTMRTSFYMEPVTSYRYSCYFDPCTCSYQQVAIPCTSYVQRARCCPVTTYLQRTCTTPVTTYQRSFYYEPVTTCCTTSSGGAVAAPPSGATVVPGPGVESSSEPGPGPGPGSGGNGGGNSTVPPPGFKARPIPADGGGSGIPDMPPESAGPSTGETRYPRRRTPVSPAYTASARGGEFTVEGRVVDVDRLLLPSARVLIINSEDKKDRRSATADRNGLFRVNLPAGDWLVYTYDDGGKLGFSRRIEVGEEKVMSVTFQQR